MLSVLRLVKRTLLSLIPTSIKRYLKSRSVGHHPELTSGEKDFFNLISGNVRTVVDVGARTDIFYSKTLEKLAKDSSVYMFEANPVFAQKLLAKTSILKQRNIVIDKAIGSEVGELTYFYDTQSFIAGSNVGTVSKLKSRKPISVTTLDLYFKDLGDIDFLKTDIEEMDFHALLGASEILRKVKFLQFELGIGAELKEGKTVSNRMYWELLENEFHLFILKDTNPIWQRWPRLPLLLCLDTNSKLIIEVLQKTGAGFNIVGVRKGIGLESLFREESISIAEYEAIISIAP